MSRKPSEANEQVLPTPELVEVPGTVSVTVALLPKAAKVVAETITAATMIATATRVKFLTG
jgi:hypothetical protein